MRRREGHAIFFIYWYTMLVIAVTVAAILFDRFFLYCQTTSSQAVHETLGSTDPHHYHLGSFCSMNIVQFMDSNINTSSTSCTLTSIGFSAIIYVILLSVIINGIILVTSIWTFCFILYFHQSSVTAGESVYASRKKRPFGILDICWLSTFFALCLVSFTSFLICLLRYLWKGLHSFYCLFSIHYNS